MTKKPLPPGPNSEYLGLKGWEFRRSTHTRSGHVANIWFDVISQEEFTQSEAMAWQKQRDNEPDLPGIGT